MGRGRRGKGEGTIYRRKDGLWGASLDLGYIDGKRKRIYVYAATRKEAAEKLADLRQQQQQGVNLAAEKQTVGQYLDYWLENHVQGAQSTKTRTEVILRKHIKPAIGHIELKKLNAQHIQAMIRSWQDRCSENTLSLYYASLRNALNRAVRLGLIARNPMDALDPPAPGESPGKSITREHEQRIFTYLEETRHRLREMIFIAIKTGLRQGEMTALLWSDVDLDKGTLYVRRGKTKASKRTLFLLDDVIASFRRQWAFQNLERTIHNDWKEHALVFTTHKGGPLTESNLYHAWHTIQTNIGLPREEQYRWHDLRHTATTRLAEAGVHPSVAREILGHTSIATTMEIYTHVDAQAQRAAFAKLTANEK
jgi:integrase